MTHEDEQLLAHYIELGAEPWNHSAEAAWYDFEIRAWIERHLPARRPLRACNVGIGAGRFDDWLGHALGEDAQLVSVDRDAVCCRMLALRQAREEHPFPSTILCGDVLAGVLDEHRFDLITVVGSTLRENGELRDEVEQAIVNALAPGGIALIAESLPIDEPAPRGAEIRTFGFSQLALRTRSWLACV